MPRQNGRLVVRPWLDETEATSNAAEASTTTILKAAQRSDEPVVQFGGGEYALGVATIAPSESQNNVVVVGLPMPAGLSATVARIRSGAEMYWATYRVRNGFRRL